ncbi:MAG: ATP-grasp domain-containing protein, partial [Candidatus Hydrogenedentes bacterium]|nr:ATP-grasp domain-containing protein [Candidatus Hydrogenedentota bacterium]
VKTSFNPLYRAVTTIDDALEAAKRLPYPIVVKPADGNSSKGVRLIGPQSDLVDAFEHALHFSECDTVLMEECVEGEEFCVDGLVYNGRYILGGITGKEVSAPPNRFDECIFMPPALDRAVFEEIEACTQEALETIGFRNGTTHVEIIMSEDGPRIVEIAGRPGGGRIPTDLIPLAYGTDFMADSIRIALGEAPKESREKEGAAALFWIPAAPGEVQAIEGVEEARAVPGVREVVVHTLVGDTLASIVDCVTRDRVGYVLAEGDTAEDALMAARRAANCCKIRTAPADSHA